MNLNKFEPWHLVNSLQQRRAPIRLQRLPHSAAGLHRDASAEHAADWLPAVDIIEEDTRFVLRADLPGVDPDDIDISAENGTLSVSGARLAESPAETGGVQRLERHSGKFVRRFTLPDTADTDAISAKSKHGTLEISIPKQPLQSRRVIVEAA